MIVVILLVVLVSAYVVYNHYAGTSPLRDWIDERRVRGLSLSELDARYLAQQERSEIVVSLTTIPSRIDLLDLTLKSLLLQSLPPKAIHLNLPEHSVREQRPYVIPAWLAELRSVTIVRCRDDGPATKLIPCFSGLDPRQKVLVVDDDRIYPRDLIAKMSANAARHPGAIICASGWRAPADLIDRPTNWRTVLTRAECLPIVASAIFRTHEVDIMQGLMGYLVEPRFFDADAVQDFSRAPPEARYCDDVWLSAHTPAKKVVCRMSRVSFTPERDRKHYYRTALARINSRPRVEDRSNTILLRYFADRWASRRPR